MLAALQERTQYRPTTDSALMKWIVRHDLQWWSVSRKVAGVRRICSSLLTVFAMVSNGADTCEVAQCRFDDGCWRPLCPYRHSGRGRAAMWARVWLTLAAVETERLAPQGVEEAAMKQETVEGMGEMPEIIVVSDTVDGISHRERVQQRTVEQIEDVLQFREETVDVVTLFLHERVQPTVEETVEVVKLVSQERVQQWTVDAPRPQDKSVLPKRVSGEDFLNRAELSKYPRLQAQAGACSVQWCSISMSLLR